MKLLANLFKSLDEKVQEDRENLVLKLKSADVRELITQMGNQEPISKNIVRKQKRDQSFGSRDSPSWFAYEVSDALNDTSLKPELLALLNDKAFSDKKAHTYRCLASLCVNTLDFELFRFLMAELQRLDDEDTITFVLNRLAHLKIPKNINIDYLKHLLANGNYQHRIDALSALQNCEHPEIEDLLIKEFKISDLHTKEMICATLRTTGTEKCFEVLTSELKRTRSGDLKYFIESALEDIAARMGGAGQ